jgi:molybdenum cofactor biosynthesis protein B
MSIDPTREFKPMRIAVLTVSDTRSRSEDASGDLLVDRIARAGHLVKGRTIVNDEVEAITTRLREWIADPQIDCVISTGGTGLTARDVTPEAFARVCEKDIPRVCRTLPSTQLRIRRDVGASVATMRGYS